MASPRTGGGGPAPVRIRVLVVDDEPAICAAVASALMQAGYDALSALSGDVTAEGRKMIAECGSPLVRKPYDIEVLLDTVAALCPLSREEIA